MVGQGAHFPAAGFRKLVLAGEDKEIGGFANAEAALLAVELSLAGGPPARADSTRFSAVATACNAFRTSASTSCSTRCLSVCSCLPAANERPRLASAVRLRKGRLIKIPASKVLYFCRNQVAERIFITAYKVLRNGCPERAAEWEEVQPVARARSAD